MIMRKIFLYVFAFCASFNTIGNFAHAQTPQESIVNKYGDLMTSWCNSGDDSYREMIEKLTQGELSCRIDNGIMKIFVENDNTGLLSKGTSQMDSYLNKFSIEIEKGMKYKHSKPLWQKNYVEPVAYADKTESPLFFISMDYSTTGSLKYSGADLYFVRDNKITKIIDFNDDNSLAKAIELYSSHKYEDAFKIFRKLAYESPNNYDAQYYTAVMEIKKQGCDFLGAKVRDTEAAWWITRGALANSISRDWSKTRMSKLYVRYGVKEKELPFNLHGKDRYVFCLMAKKLCSEGMVASKNKKNKYGFLNEAGKVVIPYIYDNIYPFDKIGLAWVVKNNKIGYINKKGIAEIPFMYDAGLSQFKDGKTYVISDGVLQLIDSKGKVLKIVGGDYDNMLADWIDGKAEVHHKKTGEIHLFDSNGNFISSEKSLSRVDYVKHCYYRTDGYSGKRIMESPYIW